VVTAEFEVLREVARPRPNLERFRQSLGDGVDYAALVTLAASHGVRPALLDCLGKVSWGSMPAAERAELERFRQYHLARTLTLAGDLAQLAADLAGRSIRFVAFKGPTLSLALYGDLAGREYNDLDLIVPPEQVDVAEDAILSMDYRSPQGDRTFRRMFLSPQRQYAFVRDEAHTAIDLHWAFSGSHVPFPLAAADAWESAIPLTVGNRTVPVLSTPNLALLLAGHGTKEGWTMLKWVSDFARLVDRHPDLDWEELYRRARDRRCGEAVLLACSVAQTLLEVPIPEALGDFVAGSDRVRRRTAAVAASLRDPAYAPRGIDHFTDLLLCDRWIDRTAARLKLTFTPTAGDHAALQLPPALWGAYYVTRPCRLAFRAVLGRA
jgi:hypothetical protein